MNIKNRVEKLFSLISNVEVVVIINASFEPDPNFYYFTGFEKGIYENAALFIFRDHIDYIANILDKKPKPNDFIVYKKSFTSKQEFKEIIKEYGKNALIGVNGEYLPFLYVNLFKKDFGARDVIDISSYINELRVVKDEDEIEKIKRASDLMKEIIEEVYKEINVGMTEKEVESKIINLINERSDGPSFEPIISFGANAAIPHHLPDNTKLKENEVVLFDVGLKYENYCSDVTRTFFFKPDKNSKEYKLLSEAYEVVEEAQKLGLEKAKEGVKGKEVYSEVLNFIDNAKGGKFKGKFIHSLGHSVGLEVHDPGIEYYLAPYGEKPLKENMVFSDEPGIYIEGIGGIRIEDEIVIKKDKSIFL